MSEISKLEPRRVWEIFDAITRVPRPSKKEGRIIAFLEDFAREHGLEYKKDDAGNIVILRQAAKEMEGRPTVILQSHMDMVCEKNSDVEIDFEKDPIQAYAEGGWVRARGTTLGADDGIGMAAALAVVSDPSLELPAIEALFTVDEETGLTGAFNLGRDMLTGKYLINLDSEDEGEIFIGCAGGIDTLATFEYDAAAVLAGMAFFRIGVSGLQGGHSGDNIDDGRANANKLLTRTLLRSQQETGLRLAAIDGGNLRNAIPREAFAVVGVPADSADKLKAIVAGVDADVKGEFKLTDPKVSIRIKEAPAPDSVFEAGFQRRLIAALQGLPNGVLAMSFAMPGMVETSTNLASVKPGGKGKLVVTTSQRSSVDSARFDAAASVRSVFELAGAQVVHSDGYPGWNPDPTSRLLAVTKDAYKKLFGKEPLVRAIHAGLECGLFLKKYPGLEMVSFGPTILGVHSPDERLQIGTVDMFWIHLIETLRSI